MQDVFWTHDNKPVYINNLFRGAHCFLILGGPSANDLDLDKLYNPSIMTMGVNNSPATFRPRLWTMVDDVKSFMKSIYTDVGILKFMPQPKSSHRIWDNMAGREDRTKVIQCPSVLYYKRQSTESEWFRTDTFLADQNFCWGNHEDRCECGWKRPGKVKKCKKCGHDEFRRGKKCKKCGWERPAFIKVCKKCGESKFGVRSVMLVAMRILYELGFKYVYLVGCDFKMEHGKKNYSFDQDRSKGSVSNNTQTYTRLNERFPKMRPVFDINDFFVYNCYEQSGLTAFDYLPFEEAVARALAHIPAREKTAGLYDRKAKAKEAAKQQEKAAKCAAVERLPQTLVEFAERLKNGS